MKLGICHILYIAIPIPVMVCTGAVVGEAEREPQASDTLYTEAAAMAAHTTQPGSGRALLIIDSAETVGNLLPYETRQELIGIGNF